MSFLALENLSVTRGRRTVLEAVSMTIGPGEYVGLIGPNGAGKTTLMRAALGLLPHTGHASLAALPPRTRAKLAAWMPQSREIAWPVDVETLVTLGRIPHLPTGARGTEADRAAVDEALEQMGLEPFRHRIATRLSGGEQARVLIARALAQEAPLLMADEPIAGLDPAQQFATMRRFRKMAEAGRSVFAALHDLPLAARFCTRLALLGQGRLVADGAPHDVLTPSNMAQVFGVQAGFSGSGSGAVFQVLDVVE